MDLNLKKRDAVPYQANFGRMQERSVGKDTTTGHWEIAGVIFEEPFALFEKFPEELVEAIERENGIGLSAIKRGVAPRSLMTSAPNTSEPRIQFFTLPRIPYCRATYEDVISAERLHEICRVARRLADRYRVGRVIARPFLGKAENFQRSTRRHDLSIKPPPTMLNAIADQSLPVISVEKISDILRAKA